MKKTLILMLAVALACGTMFTGCNFNGKDTDDAFSEQSSSVASTENTEIPTTDNETTATNSTEPGTTDTAPDNNTSTEPGSTDTTTSTEPGTTAPVDPDLDNAGADTTPGFGELIRP